MWRTSTLVVVSRMESNRLDPATNPFHSSHLCTVMVRVWQIILDVSRAHTHGTLRILAITRGRNPCEYVNRKLTEPTPNPCTAPVVIAD